MMEIAVLTGAGISKESGLDTFRDAGGLWEGYDVMKVASIEGWNEDPETVLRFYNDRRSQAYHAKPNRGHKALAELEETHDVTVITQNVDNLHEKAGSSQVLHLHGSLFEARSENDESLVKSIDDENIQFGDKAEDGGQWRPNIVWFGEMVPMLSVAADVVSEADVLLVVGTSLVVYPAAGLIDYYEGDFPIGVTDPGEASIHHKSNVEYVREPASIGVDTLIKRLKL